MSFELNVDGVSHTVEVDDDTPLLWVLRDELNILGPKFGCGIAQCGACTVYMDGVPVRACATPVEAVGEARITTIDGLSGMAADAVRAAWVELDVPQCGYCQAGQVMSASALLAQNPRPTDHDIDEAMAGNVCRCATYARIRKAIHLAARKLEG